MRCLLAVLLLLTSLTAGAQTPWFDRVSIRESLDKKKVPEPAFVTLVLPNKADDTYSVGIGALFNALMTSTIESGPFLEYARNTATDKQQDSLKVGWNLDWTPGDLAAQPSIHLVRAKANHQRDGIKDTESVQLSTYYTRLYRGRAGSKEYWYVPNVETNLGGATFLYSPYLGLEYENIISAKTAAAETSTFRSYARLYAVVTATGRFRKLVEFTLDMTHRSDLSGHATDKTHLLLQLGSNLYFYRAPDGERAFGVGFAYINGEDPTYLFTVLIEW